VLAGVTLLWFVLTALALLFVAIDSRSTPASPVLKWGFVLLTAYTGVFGAFLYILGCREPLPGTHEQYVHARWRQVLGSTMHCVAGDGVGILAGAVISSIFGLRGPSEVLLEYVLGFAFGWTIFQSLFMRDMAGGSYKRALGSTFVPELLSMNLLMAGMIPAMMILRAVLAPTAGPDAPAFWFVMSMALLVGFITAYPMNWWLVSNGLKHGMLTVRRSGTRAAADAPVQHGGKGGAGTAGNDHGRPAPTPSIPIMTLVSFLALTVGAVIAWLAVSRLPGG
jgi:hypothetical protein